MWRTGISMEHRRARTSRSFSRSPRRRSPARGRSRRSPSRSRSFDGRQTLSEKPSKVWSRGRRPADRYYQRQQSPERDSKWIRGDSFSRRSRSRSPQSIERRVPSRGRSPSAHQHNVSGHRRSPSPRVHRAYSQHQYRSRSPRRRSPNPYKRKTVQRRRSPSPRRRSPSPRRRSPSLHSQRPRSGRRSPSPQQWNDSFHRRNISTRAPSASSRSRSPSLSPRGRSSNPRQRSPNQRAHSPTPRHSSSARRHSQSLRRNDWEGKSHSRSTSLPRQSEDGNSRSGSSRGRSRGRSDDRASAEPLAPKLSPSGFGTPKLNPHNAVSAEKKQEDEVNCVTGLARDDRTTDGSRLSMLRINRGEQSHDDVDGYNDQLHNRRPVIYDAQALPSSPSTHGGSTFVKPVGVSVGVVTSPPHVEHSSTLTLTRGDTNSHTSSPLLLVKKREAQRESHRAYLKSNSDYNVAEMKNVKIEAELRLAEFYLDIVTKDLEDVGKRIEVHDWNFQKIMESGGFNEA